MLPLHQIIADENIINYINFLARQMTVLANMAIINVGGPHRVHNSQNKHKKMYFKKFSLF